MQTTVNPDQLTIILVRPLQPGNIGAVARAMQNMGLHRLALVAPERFPHPEARMMACGAEEILYRTVVHDTLEAAEKAGAPLIKYGVFINTIINFVIIAFAIFVAIKAINKLQRAKPAPAPEPPAEPEDVKLLREIRDALKQR